MANIQVNCPKCGAFITVNTDEDASFCVVCARPFVTSEAFRTSPVIPRQPAAAAPTPVSAEFMSALSTSQLSDFDIEYGVLKKYKGGKSYVVIPDCVKEIGSNAFLTARNLRVVALPGSVTKIGALAFSECRTLGRVNIPGGVTSIGRGAFSGCKSLTSISLPKGVLAIERETFWGCSSLKTVTFSELLQRIDTKAFDGCTSLKAVQVPQGAQIAPDAFPFDTKVVEI